LSLRTRAGDATGQRTESSDVRRQSKEPSVLRGTAMFQASTNFTLFDYFRVPYSQSATHSDLPAGVAAVRVGDEPAPLLAWPRAELLEASRRRPASYSLGRIPIFGHVADEAQLREWTSALGGTWRSQLELRDQEGNLVAAVRQRDDGSTLLPFDPNDVVASYWTERYLEYARPAALRLAALARRTYYRARPLLPRGVQMGMRRSFSRVQSRTVFPRWPVETALHDLYDLLFEFVAGVAQRPVPYIGCWPQPWSWSLVLTHDVETKEGYGRVDDLLQIELEAGYRSSWNLVPRSRYDVEPDFVESLEHRGFEVGVHGLYHDGRDVSSLRTLRRRMPVMHAYAEQWHATGFRSPATLRSAHLLSLLEFDYDSSYTDTAPFEPQAGGCCTWLPYMLGRLVELPITLTQDHTLFELLGHRDENVWVDKAQFLRERGGMSLVLTHPDYVGNRDLLESYRRLLARFSDDATVWKALPRDVSQWWRRRAGSFVEVSDGEWRVVGAAGGEARVDFVRAR
jgi:peptidoglycan/xylan/chitin deacetylase (PgdA/CDA1 family)